MPSPRIYSVRFMHCGPPAQSVSYDVPAGKRAVVRAVTWVVANASEGRVWLFVAGVVCWGHYIQASFTGGAQELRLTAYAGELIQLTTEGADTRAHVSGFLFDDLSGGREAEVLPAPDPGPPPLGPSVTPLRAPYRSDN